MNKDTEIINDYLEKMTNLITELRNLESFAIDSEWSDNVNYKLWEKFTHARKTLIGVQGTILEEINNIEYYLNLKKE